MTHPTEHVEPVAPVGGRGRSRGVLAAIVPLVVLVGVVGIGVVGNGAAPAPTPTVPPAATSRPAEAATTPTPQPTERPRLDTAHFPTRVAGIPTVDAAESNRMAKAGIASDRLIAVTGWLTLSPPSADCAKAWELCRRIGLLSDVPTVDGGSALFLETRPDVTINGVARAARRSDEWTVPATAVVVGRFVPRVDRECGLRRPVCERVFAAELIAWLDGGIAEHPTVQPRGQTGRGARMTADEAAATARRAIRGAGEVIAASLVDQDRLATLEQDAAVVASSGDGLVWLVRAVSFNARLDVWYEPLAGWAVVDDATGEVLAAQPGRRFGSGIRP